MRAKLMQVAGRVLTVGLPLAVALASSGWYYYR